MVNKMATAAAFPFDTITKSWNRCGVVDKLPAL